MLTVCKKSSLTLIYVTNNTGHWFQFQSRRRRMLIDWTKAFLLCMGFYSPVCEIRVVYNISSFLVNNYIKKNWLMLLRYFINNLWSIVVYNFSPVCLSDDNFLKPLHRNFIFAHLVYLQGIEVKFIYEDHQFKVTGATKVDVKFWSAITTVL